MKLVPDPARTLVWSAVLHTRRLPGLDLAHERLIAWFERAGVPLDQHLRPKSGVERDVRDSLVTLCQRIEAGHGHFQTILQLCAGHGRHAGEEDWLETEDFGDPRYSGRATLPLKATRQHIGRLDGVEAVVQISDVCREDKEPFSGVALGFYARGSSSADSNTLHGRKAGFSAPATKHLFDEVVGCFERPPCLPGSFGPARWTLAELGEAVNQRRGGTTRKHLANVEGTAGQVFFEGEEVVMVFTHGARAWTLEIEGQEPIPVFGPSGTCTLREGWYRARSVMGGRLGPWRGFEAHRAADEVSL